MDAIASMRRPHGSTIRRRVFAVDLLQKQRGANLETITDCTRVQATEGAVQPPEPPKLAGWGCAIHFSGSTKTPPILGRAAMTDRIADVPVAPAEAVSPSGINHLVLNVRDIDESHKFWPQIVGFQQVGELH